MNDSHQGGHGGHHHEGGGDHPIAGLFFLVLALTGIGYGSVSAVAGAKQSVIDAEKRVSEEIMEAVKVGREGNLYIAVRRLEKVIEHHPDNVDALYNIGVALAGLDQHADAEKFFDEVHRLAPGDFDAVAEKALIRFTLGDAEAALALLNTVPLNEGNLKKRLAEDPRWAGALGDERFKPLFDKHGIQPPPSTPPPPIQEGEGESSPDLAQPGEAVP